MPGTSQARANHKQKKKNSKTKGVSKLSKRLELVQKQANVHCEELLPGPTTIATKKEQIILDTICSIMTRVIYSINDDSFHTRSAGDPLCSSTIRFYLQCAAYRFLWERGVVVNKNSNDVADLPRIADDMVLPSAFCALLLNLLPYRASASETTFSPIIDYDTAVGVTQCSLITSTYNFRDADDSGVEVQVTEDTAPLSNSTASDAFSQVSQMIRKSMYKEGSVEYGNLVKKALQMGNRAPSSAAHAVRIATGAPGSGASPERVSVMASCDDNFDADTAFMLTLGDTPVRQVATFYRQLSLCPQAESEEFMARSYLHVLSQCLLKRGRVAAMLKTHPLSTNECPVKSPYVVQNVIDNDVIGEMVRGDARAHVGSTQAELDYDSTTTDSDAVVNLRLFSTYCWSALLSKVLTVSGPFAHRDFENSGNIGRHDYYSSQCPMTKLPFMFSQFVSGIGPTNNCGVIHVPTYVRDGNVTGFYDYFNTTNTIARSIFSLGLNIPAAATCVNGYSLDGDSIESLLTGLSNLPIVPVKLWPRFARAVPTVGGNRNFYKTDTWVSPPFRGGLGGLGNFIVLGDNTPNFNGVADYISGINPINDPIPMRGIKAFNTSSPYRLMPSSLMLARATAYMSSAPGYISNAIDIWEDVPHLVCKEQNNQLFSKDDAEITSRLYGPNDGSPASFAQLLVANIDGTDGQTNVSNVLTKIFDNDMYSIIDLKGWTPVTNREVKGQILYMVYTTNAVVAVHPIPYGDKFASGSRSWFTKMIYGGMNAIADIGHFVAPFIEAIPQPMAKDVAKGLKALEAPK